MLCVFSFSFSHSLGDLKTGKKVVIFPGHRKGIEGVVGHTGHVQALSVSSDGKFLVSCVCAFCYRIYKILVVGGHQIVPIHYACSMELCAS